MSQPDNPDNQVFIPERMTGKGLPLGQLVSGWALVLFIVALVAYAIFFG